MKKYPQLWNWLKRHVKPRPSQFRETLRDWLFALFIVFLVLTLTACASPTPPSQVKPSANLVQPCRTIIPLEGTDGASLLRNITTNAAIFWECSDSKAALIQAVK